jgi:hypothetical protein
MMNDNSSTRSLIDELPGGVKENMSPGEKVLHYLKTFQVVERPNYIILTNNRIVYFNEKHLGRYEIKSIPFQKLLEMKAQRGVLVWGDISLKSEDGTVVELDKVDRNDLEGFIEALKKAINDIAVEPISIEHRNDLVGKASWEFKKPAELIFRQQPSTQPTTSEDPVAQLKTMFAKGEIPEEEYRARLRVLQEK